jgi:calcineurin-like phosphoesterase family protein
MAKTWFAGCTHWGHANMIKLADRPFKDVQQMDEHMFDLFNVRVQPEDTLIHLGDLAWGAVDRVVRKLNGKLIVVYGNHDYQHDEETGQPWFSDEWRGIERHPYLEFPTMGPRGVVCFHYPMEDWNGRFRGSLHLHAHTHVKQLKRPLLPYLSDTGIDKGDKTGDATQWGLPKHFPKDIVCNRFHVGVDATPNFGPIELDQLVALSRGQE